MTIKLNNFRDFYICYKITIYMEVDKNPNKSKAVEKDK